MIVGVGIDMVQVSSIQRLLDQPGSPFEERTFSAEERTAARQSSHPAQRLAGFFAVKEAVYKALSPHSRAMGLDLRTVCTRYGEDGAPHVVIDDGIRPLLEAAGVGSILVSITNEGDFALAVALAQTD